MLSPLVNAHFMFYIPVLTEPDATVYFEQPVLVRIFVFLYIFAMNGNHVGKSINLEESVLHSSITATHPFSRKKT